MKARPYILAETNWKAVKATDYQLAVLPWGATEAHNYHLPYCTDNAQCDYIAAEAAKIAWDSGAKVIVLPTVPFGVNTGQLDVKLDLNLYPSTQMAILNDLTEVLNRQEIHKLLILNGHGGNDFKQMVRELGVRFPEMFISICNWYNVADWQDFFTDLGDHAGELETSVMLHISPELVRPLSEAGDGKTKNNKITGIREGWAWSERPWTKVTNDTGSGNPKLASAHKGDEFLKVVVRKISSLFQEIAEADTNDLYD